MQVLKNDTVNFSFLSDYQVKDQVLRLERLRRLEAEENNIAINNKEKNRIYNLSLKNIFDNLLNFIIQMVNDLTIFINSPKKDLNSFIFIFTKDDRLIYFGILILIISLILFFISGTN